LVSISMLESIRWSSPGLTFPPQLSRPGVGKSPSLGSRIGASL